MKKVKTIVFSVAIVLVSLFLCSAGCENVAGGGGASSGEQQGGQPGGQQGGTPTSVTGNADTVIPVIEKLRSNSPVLTVKLTGETSISDDLWIAIKNAPYGKINLDLSQTQITDGDNTFSDLYALNSVVIGDNVTELGDALSFSGCSYLRSVVIGNNVTKIDYGAFYGCERLTSVTIPDSVTEICDWAFGSCFNIDSLTIGAGVRRIGKAFYECHGITTVTVKASEPPSFLDDAGDKMEEPFKNTPILKLYVPSASVDEYKNDIQYQYGHFNRNVGWRMYAGRIEAIPTN